MPILNFQSEYWTLVYRGIELAQKEAEERFDTIRKELCETLEQIEHVSYETARFHNDFYVAIWYLQRGDTNEFSKEFFQNITSEERKKFLDGLYEKATELGIIERHIDLYKAIGVEVLKASQKRDSIFTPKLGPDESHSVPESSDGDPEWWWQID